MPKPVLAVILDVSFVEWVYQVVEETLARELLREYQLAQEVHGAKVIPFAQTRGRPAA